MPSASCILMLTLFAQCVRNQSAIGIIVRNPPA
nr:MAG TPA: hypothetical protein [Caudoviricetes sp.]